MTETQAATQHRSGCPSAEWFVTRSTAIPGLLIARCSGYGAVALHRETTPGHQAITERKRR